MTARYGHVALRARDLEKTAAFYREVLGFPEAFRMPGADGAAVGSVHIRVAPRQFIEIFPGGVEPPPPGETRIGPHHICLEVDDAKAALEEIRARGAPIDTELKKGLSRAVQFWTHDPDGTSIEFMELPPDCLQLQAPVSLNI